MKFNGHITRLQSWSNFLLGTDICSLLQVFSRHGATSAHGLGGCPLLARSNFVIGSTGRKAYRKDAADCERPVGFWFCQMGSFVLKSYYLLLLFFATDNFQAFGLFPRSMTGKCRPCSLIRLAWSIPVTFSGYWMIIKWTAFPSLIKSCSGNIFNQDWQ